MEALVLHQCDLARGERGARRWACRPPSCGQKTDAECTQPSCSPAPAPARPCAVLVETWKSAQSPKS